MLAGVLAVQMIQSPTPNLNEIAKNAYVSTKVALPKENLKPADVAITIHQLDRATSSWQSGSMNGAELIYPASVVKLFWLAYLSHLVATDKLTLTPEIVRAARDMIVGSNNDATGAIVNVTTGALPGPELEGRAFRDWADRRLAANKWFETQEIANQNVINRTYNEGPYGREAQMIKQYGRNANSTDATARLMSQIALDTMVNPEQCAWMKGFLKREIPASGKRADSQTLGYIGEVMPRGTQHWSKAGWTSEVRHDVSYNVMPDGREFVFCIFTRRPNNERVLQTIAVEVLKSLGYEANAPKS